MAKKQSFNDKTSGKNTNTKNKVKLIKSSISSKTNSIRFSEEMVTIPDGKSVESVLKEVVDSK